ncbi:MAG TPA: hypothetical protein VHE09_16305 [Rhizomicrobium sp.]|nr:hypothetical protein [Rhizomicrobium sp.]
MRELHASVLFMQGIPIVVIVLLAIWIAYYVRVAVTELRAIRGYLEWFADREEEKGARPGASSCSGANAPK